MAQEYLILLIFWYSVQSVDADLATVASCTLINKIIYKELHCSRFPQLQHDDAKEVGRLIVTDCAQEALTSLTELHMKNFTKLHSLEISRCGLETVSHSTFQHNTDLTDLNLAGNNMKVLPLDAILGAFSLRQLTINGNPFVCNCSMQWVAIFDWKIKAKGLSLFAQIENTECTYPNGTSQLLVEVNIPNCDEPTVTVHPAGGYPDLEAGEALNLTCEASGIPQPTVEWMTRDLNSEFFISTSGSNKTTLHITNLSSEDNGPIKCRGTNEAFQDYANVTLLINLAARMKELRYHENGDCIYYIVSGTPNVSIEWTFNGRPIVIDGDKWRNQSCEATNACEFHQLSGCLKEKVHTYGGIFRIQVTNRFGSDEDSISLGSNDNINGIKYSNMPTGGILLLTSTPHTDGLTERSNDQKQHILNVVAPVAAAVIALGLIIFIVARSHIKRYKRKTSQGI